VKVTQSQDSRIVLSLIILQR